MTAIGFALAALSAVAAAQPIGAQRLPIPKRPWIGEACKQEFSTLCGDLPLNSRRDAIIECLKKHPDEISHDCSEAISDRPDGVGTPGVGRGAQRHRGRRTGEGDSGGRGPFGGSGF